MTKKEDKERKSNRDLLLILLILPFAVLCMFLTGQVAIKLAPTWILPADMLSHQNPNYDFEGLGIPLLLEPLDPGILTQPPWDRFYLTPYASIPTRMPGPTQVPIRTVQPPPPVVNTPEENNPPPSTATVAGPIIIPTKPGPQVAELVVTKTDNSATYTPGTSINYTIVVQNLGPDDAPRFNVIDDIPAVVTGLTANCTPAGSCGTNTSSGNRVSFTAASIYFDQTDRIIITVSGLVASGATGNLSNSVEAVIPQGAGYQDDNLGNNVANDIDTQRSVYDVAITKSDSIDTFTAATTQLDYVINVTNSGPSDAIGITINDAIPTGITSWSWTCITANPTCKSVADNMSNFNDMVTIQSGGSIQYAVTANLATTPLDISNTASIIIPNPGMNVDPNLANNSATDNSIPLVDLVVDKNGTAPTYTAGGPVSYTITVTNNSTFVVNDVTVVDKIPALIDPSTWTWTCNPNPPPGANCDTLSGTGNINTTVDLPPGTSVNFNINATVYANAIGTLYNTASISPPTGLTDSTPGNNTDTFSETNPNGPNVGPPDGVVISPAGGTTSTYFFSPAITNDGGSTPDFVFYERDTGTGIALDRVIIYISADGSPGSWTRVFNWGDGLDDTNSNMSLSIIGDGGDPSNPEPDDRAIPYAELYNNTGVTIDIDSLGLSGTYPWIQFYCPTVAEGNTDNACDIDSIQPYYP